MVDRPVRRRGRTAAAEEAGGDDLASTSDQGDMAAQHMLWDACVMRVQELQAQLGQQNKVR